MEIKDLFADKTTDELVQASKAEISRLCQTGKWRMCVPVQWDDSDVLLSETIKRLISERDKAIAKDEE